MTDSLFSDFVADGQPFENPEASADTAYAATVPTLGAKLGADFGDGLTAALGRAAQRGQQQGASWFDRLATMPDVDTAAGMVAGGQDPYPEPAPSPTISAEDANKRFAPPGTTITDGPMSEGLARVVGQQKADEIKRDSVLGRYAAGHGTLTNLGVGLALSPLMDPVGSAALFVPGIGEEAVAAHLGEGLLARTGARVVAGASAGAAGMGVAAGAKYALGTEQDSDYTLRSAMYDMAGGAALGALGHAGFGALREAGILKPDGLMMADRSRAGAGFQPAEAPTGLVSNEDLGAVVDAPASARFDALNAGVAQVLDGREVDVAPIFDQVRADRAEADLQRWSAQQGRLDAQSTAALQASSLSDAAAGTVESRAAVLQKRLDDLRGQRAGFLADIERAEAQRVAQTDTVTPQRLQAIDAELSDTAIPAARRADLEGERALLTEGRDPAADALEAARTEAELRGLQRGAAAVQADMDRTAAKVEPLQVKAAAQRAAGSGALDAASDRITAQEGTLRSLAARSIRRYAGAFGADVTRDEADALALRTLRGGPDEVAKVVTEIRDRVAPATARTVQPATTLPGPPIEQQRAAIANDVTRQLVAAGRPEREARAHARIVAAHYEARASRFGGALGTAEDLYRQRAAEIRGPDAAPTPVTTPADDGRAGGAAVAPDDAAMVQMLADRGEAAAGKPPVVQSVGISDRLPPDAAAPTLPAAPAPGAPVPGFDIAAEPEIAPGEPAAPVPDAVEQVAAEVMPEAVEPVRAIIEAVDEIAAAEPSETVEASTAERPGDSPASTDEAASTGQPRPLLAYTPEADAVAAPRGKDQPAGVFVFDPLALAIDAGRFQFKSGGDEYGVTGALRGVTRWDPAKAQSVMVWEQADGRLFVADGHQRAGLARRLTEGGQASGIEIPGVLYRERDGVSAEDARAIAAVTNIANGSGSALDGAKVLRSRPDLMDGSVPLSAGKGQQAAALARLDDEAFRMIVNDVVPENFGAVVGQVIPADGPRQVAALKAIARFEPRSVEEATALTQRIASAELARAEEGRQASLFGDLDAPESTAGEEMRIVARVIRDLRRDRGLFSRVVENAGRLEQAGSMIARDAARSAATNAGAFAKVLASDAYTAGPTRDTLIEAARDLQNGRATISDAAARLYAAIRRQAEEDGPDRLGAGLGDAASESDAPGRAVGSGDGRGASGSGRVGDARGSAASDAGRGNVAAAGPGGGSRAGGESGGRSRTAGGTGRQGREDATSAARRGDPGGTSGDGLGDLLARLTGDDVAGRVVPLDDRALDRGIGGEASLVDQMNELLGRKPADAPTSASRLMDRASYQGDYPGDAAVAEMVGIPLKPDVMATQAGAAVRGRLLALWNAGQAGRMDATFASYVRELRATFNLPVPQGGIERGLDGRPQVLSPNEAMLRDLQKGAEALPPASTAAGVHPDLIPAGEHVIHRVPKADGKARYEVHRTPVGGLDGVQPDALGDVIAHASLDRRDDGRWEVGLVRVEEEHRRQGIARKLYAAIEADKGITMQPSGHLFPDGYAMWKARDPEAVKWHREIDGDYLSPKQLLALAQEYPGEEGAEHRALFDALPPEAKTPEALRTMFQRRVVEEPHGLADIRRAIEAADRGESTTTLFQRREEQQLSIVLPPMGDIPASRGYFTRQRAFQDANHFDRLAAEMEASGGDATAIAERRAVAAALRDALPRFDELQPSGDKAVPRDPNAPRGVPFTRSKLIDAGRHAVTVATDERHAFADDIKTYRIYAKPEGGLDAVKTPSRDLGRELGNVQLKQRPDGRWEVAMVEVKPSARGKGVAKDLYAAVQEDLGITMRPSGILLPDGYAMWKRRDAEAVKWHQRIQDGQGNAYFVSPRWLMEHRDGWANADPTFDANMKAAEATVPPEAKTPEALATMFQGEGEPRGSITFRPGQRPLLRLMADADASTFVHEMGHDWLEQMLRDAAHPAAPEAFRADAQAVRGWLGNDGDALTVDQHERFATGFEQYLRAGVAPAPELAGVFAQLKNWLTRIYRTVVGLGAPISPEIRAVFDRLLTAEDAPQRPAVPDRPDVAALARRQQAVYRAGFALGMPQAEFDALNAAVYGAKAPAGDRATGEAGPPAKVGPGGDGAAAGAAQPGPKTAADALLATWQQQFEAAGVVPTAEERTLIEATRARVEAADLSAEGYAQAGACLTAAGI